ncbi:hypothetical protein OSJ77_00315 [Phyllobacterium sp. 0TCS1.6C]|uniref:hypothetical protein n=1 Tax=unclassified Phyllobacterium TaxID=2638441 RepID=UPI0022644991|nr:MULTISPECIES: hypothetical protein [unclassified Phyllobacterium]MCX8278631.1 hypothetical protein [Phyllobacterium sp. 0TCS1.6C]MCX8293539.1 hypothetical protein [Phyllobacterium sp. 0TCS1.6A]
MIQWMKRAARRACLFSGLLATLAGCNDTGDTTPESRSTFPTIVALKAETPPVSTDSAEKPVIGNVTIVPGTTPDTHSRPPARMLTTDPQLVIDYGKPAEIVPVPIKQEVKLQRFTEIAPDTIAGATFTSSPVYQYDLGNLVVSSAQKDLTSASDDTIFITPIKGWIRFPGTRNDTATPTARYPVIVMQHGNHTAEDPSYQGYDYLAENLAQSGYVTISIDANAINSGGDPRVSNGDKSSQSRGQLILGTLDRLRQIDKSGQIDKDGNAGPLNELKGKLDFTRIGIMGHSRGGQGVSNAIKFNQTRVGVTDQDLRTALVADAGSFAQRYPDLAAAFLPTKPAGKLVDPAPPAPTKATDLADRLAKLDKEQVDRLYTHMKPEGPSGLEPRASGPREKISYENSILLRAAETILDGKSAGTLAMALEQLEKEFLPAGWDVKKIQAAFDKYNLFFAAGRESAAPYDFRGAFMLAPTDFYGNQGLNNVPLAVLLPSCDGDMSNLKGAVSFDHARFGPVHDTAPRYQIMVKGANHNYYNTIWTNDDYATKDKSYCSANRLDSIRLNDMDQRRGGLFVINSFMRYHVGGEMKFAAYWNGNAQLPEAACPAEQGPCDERIVLTVQKPEKNRKLIQGFRSEERLERNAFGGKFKLSGFNITRHCTMPLGTGEADPCQRLAGFEYKPFGGMLSIADRAELSWAKPGASIVTELPNIPTEKYDSLTFRIAVVRPIGQEVEVTLTDGAGKSATVEASDFSDALYNAPRPKGEGRPRIDDPRDKPFGDGNVSSLLNMVAIPLKAFAGIDLNNLKELKLTFPKESGKVALADIQFQTFGRDQFGPRLVAVKN